MAQVKKKAQASTTTSTGTKPRPTRGEMAVLWVLLAISFGAAFMPATVDGSLSLVIGLVPVAFALWHFAWWAGAATAWLSFAAVVVVSFFGEALGVATGLVFGNYYYPDGPLGPLLLGVPPLIQLQYFAMAYASLMMARAVSGSLTRAVGGWRAVWVAAMAAFGMALLDFASDPWHATVLGQWIWNGGGPYFGIPIQNFFGWFFETLVFLLIIQWLLRRKRAVAHIEAPKPRGFVIMGALLYGTFPLAIVMIPLINTTYGDGKPLTGEPLEIAQSMLLVALFAVVPLWVASLLALRSSRAHGTN
jgi:putative membrane protein